MDLQTGEMNTDLGAGKKMLLCVFLSFQPLQLLIRFSCLLLCSMMGVMRIKEEAMFCNLPQEMFSKSLGMLKQNWVADVDCIVFASIITIDSL